MARTPSVLYSDLLIQVRERLNCSRDDATKALDAVVASIAAVVARGDKLKLKGLGVFEPRIRHGGIRKIRGVPTQVPDSPNVAFRCCPEIKDALRRRWNGDEPVEHQTEAAGPESPPPGPGRG